MRISRIRLSDKTSRLHPRLAAPKLGQADESEAPVEVREGIRPAPAAPDLVLVAQPPAQPRSGVVVGRTVGPVGRPYPRVVRPAAQGAVQLLHQLRGLGASSPNHRCTPVRLDIRELLSIHARRAPIGAALGIGSVKNILAVELVVQGIEAIAGLSLRFRV